MANVQRGLTLGLLALGALAIAIALSAGASAVRDPCNVIIVPNNGVLAIGVKSDVGGSSSGSGYVTFVDPPGESTTTVTLTQSTDNGWPVTISPASFLLNDQARVDFEYTVTAPAAEPAGPAGNLTIDARVVINGFACTAPEPANVELRVGRYVDVFGARLVSPAGDSRPAKAGEDFDIEIQVRSNDVMRVSFIYSADQGWAAYGPSSVDIAPGYDLVATKSIHVDVAGTSMRPGYTTIDVLVQGESNGKPAYTGHLGFLIYIRDPDVVLVPSLPLFAWAAIAVVAGGGALGLVAERRAVRRRRAMLQLRRVVAQAAARGRLQRPDEPPPEPPGA